MNEKEKMIQHSTHVKFNGDFSLIKKQRKDGLKRECKKRLLDHIKSTTIDLPVTT